MKLIYVANSRIPTEKAHGLQIIKMCEAFGSLHYGEQKVQVNLVVPKRFNKIQENPFDYYEANRNFKITKLPCIDLMPWLSDLPSGNFLKKVAFFVRVLTFYFFSFFYVFFKKKNIIYTRDKFFLFYALLNKNVFYEAHTFPENYYLYSFFFKKVKKIIVITEKLKDYFVKNGIEREDIIVAPDGVDIQKFDISCSKIEARKKLGLPQDKKIVLYTGHLYKWKGVYCLAEASKYLPEGVDIYLVGGTKKDIELFQNQTSDLRINIEGHRSRSEIPYWLKAADVLILPNSGERKISRYWTSPIKMFEYMVSKRPIVASDLPSIKEVLGSDNAILFEPDDSKELAKSIQKALRHHKISGKISNQAFKDVQKYSWENRAQEIFRGVISSGTDWSKYTRNHFGSTWFPEGILDEYSGGKILDVGCGIGKHLGKIQDFVEKYGIDPSKFAIKKAKENFPECNFVNGSAYNLPWPDDFFDLVYSIDTIEHLEMPDRMIKEIQRVLKPNKYFILQTPNYPIKRIYDFINWLNPNKKWRKNCKDDPTHVSKLNYFSLRSLLEKHFTVVWARPRNILLENKIRLIKNIKKHFIGLIIGQKIVIICENNKR